MISLSMIALNEEGNLEACLESVAKHVDEIVLVDTGSTDRTVEIAKGFGAKVFRYAPDTHPEGFYLDDGKGDPPGLEATGKLQLASFSAARNFGLDRCTGDHVLWIDADDVVEGAESLRDVAREMDASGLNAAHLCYDYAHDHRGNVTVRLWRERLVRRGCGARWTNPVHEVLVPSWPYKNFSEIMIVHRRVAPRGTSNTIRNYKILLRHLESERASGVQDPRTFFYVGNEASNYDREKAVWAYQEYLERSGWDEERAVARVCLGDIHVAAAWDAGARGDKVEHALLMAAAYREYAAAAAEKGDRPEPWFRLAKLEFFKGRWQKCVEHTERGFALGDPESVLMHNPVDRSGRPHVCYSAALYNLGRFEEARESWRKGIEILPDDEHLVANRRWFEKGPVGPEHPSVVRMDLDGMLLASPPIDMPADALLEWSLQVWKRIPEPRSRKAFLEILPEDLRALPKWTEAMALTWDDVAKVEPSDSIVLLSPPMLRPSMRLEPVRSPALEIVFHVGSWGPVRPWNPETAARDGIGGSETCVIELSRELAQRGHNVTVMGDCPGQLAGEFDGVRYVHHDDLLAWTPPDVFVSSRRPAAFDLPIAQRAGARLLWVHDVHCGADLTSERMLSIDRVVALTDWHEGFLHETYPRLRKDQVTVVRNALDLSRFDAKVARNPHRGIYSSSPDRGLEANVMAWPTVRERVPDAELHVCYGFEVWEASADADARKLIEHLKRMVVGRERDGIFYHGRISQKDLAIEQLKSGVWCYATWFSETACLSAMEAHAAGLRMVTSPIAALEETVGDRGTMIEGDWMDPGYQRRWADAVADEMLRPGDEDRIALQRYARENLSWTDRAKEWEDLFHATIDENRIRVVPPFVEATL